MQQFVSFFSFPLNLFLALLWVSVCVMIWKNCPHSRVVRFLLSPISVVLSISLLLLSCLWIGFTADRGFAQSPVFIAVLMYFQTVLLMVICRGWKAGGRIRWRFLLLHAGLLLAVGSAFWGSSDSYEFRLKLYEGQCSDEAFTENGYRTGISHLICLDSLSVIMTQQGAMSHCEAFVEVDGVKQKLSVNHPLKLGYGKDLYITGVSGSTAVFQIVGEPWKYPALAGIIMMIAGAFMLFVQGPGSRRHNKSI